MSDRRTTSERLGAGLPASSRDRLIAFLRARLTEDLARIWGRDGTSRARPRPGMAAQVGVVDDLLRVLAGNRLPARSDLRMLLYGYGDHCDYEPGWSALLSA
jgi:hypothetical protein